MQVPTGLCFILLQLGKIHLIRHETCNYITITFYNFAASHFRRILDRTEQPGYAAGLWNIMETVTLSSVYVII